MKKSTVSLPLKVLCMSSLITLTACGGSGGDSTTAMVNTSVTTTGTATTTDTTASTDTVGTDVATSVDGESNEGVSVCVNEQYTILSASDDGTYQMPYSPDLSIDNGTGDESRWSSEGIGKEIVFDLNETKPLSALQIKWLKGNERIASFSVEASTDNLTWTSLLSHRDSSGSSADFEVVNLTESIDVRYFKIIGLGNSESEWNSIIEVQAYKCELDEIIITEEPEQPTLIVPMPDPQGVIISPAATGIDLLDWYLNIPTDDDSNGKSDSIFENDLANGYSNLEFYYGIEESDGDKGIVMVSPPRGYTTSENTIYTRVELREMLRRGGSGSTQGVNNNNWVFSSASTTAQNAAGGVDGELNVTLAINHVTTTYGQDLSQVKEADKNKTQSQFKFQLGRVIIGQIHANDDEPIRLYYRKLPEHTKGSIYFYHEPRTGDEVLVEIIGTKDLDTEPADGIELNEKFSYSINVVGNDLTVTISREGKVDETGTLNMTGSGFDDDDQYQYFKVGLYHLNNTASDDDYVQGTFYEIRNNHTGYNDSE